MSSSIEWFPLSRRLALSSKPGHRATRLGLIALLTGLISSAEVFLFYGYADIALWLHAATLLLCLLLPFRLTEQTTVFKAFLLLPLFRLVNLGMPIFFNITLLWYPIIYGPMIPAGILIAKDLNVSITGGWRYAIILAPLAIPLSAVMSAVEFSIVTPGALIPTDSFWEMTLLTLVMVLFVGFVEELLYRAILQRTLSEYLGFVPALLIANSLFGLMHSAYGEPLEIVFAGFLGLVYGILYRYTDSLLYITILHGILNMFLFGIYPLNSAAFGLPFAGEAVSLVP